MDIDLTSFLYAIAGCSATIIAIIGGFIASKLISISSDRDGISSRINELNEEMKFQIDRKNKIEHELNEYKALNFVEENIEDLYHGKRIEDVFKKYEKQEIDESVLKTYWNRAFEICEDIYSYSDHGNIELNSDGVIKELAIKYTKKYDYEVCKLVFEEIDREIREQENQYSSTILSVSKNVLKGVSLNDVLWEKDMNADLHTVVNRIQELNIQLDIFQDKRKAIRKPRGMMGGLFVFLSFSLGGLIYPLICAVLTEMKYISGMCSSIIAIILFIIGIGITFIYLILLLKWRE